MRTLNDDGEIEQERKGVFIEGVGRYWFIGYACHPSPPAMPGISWHLICTIWECVYVEMFMCERRSGYKGR